MAFDQVEPGAVDNGGGLPASLLLAQETGPAQAMLQAEADAAAQGQGVAAPEQGQPAIPPTGQPLLDPSTMSVDDVAAYARTHTLDEIREAFGDDVVKNSLYFRAHKDARETELARQIAQYQAQMQNPAPQPPIHNTQQLYQPGLFAPVVPQAPVPLQDVGEYAEAIDPRVVNAFSQLEQRTQELQSVLAGHQQLMEQQQVAQLDTQIKELEVAHPWFGYTQQQQLLQYMQQNGIADMRIGFAARFQAERDQEIREQVLNGAPHRAARGRTEQIAQTGPAPAPIALSQTQRIQDERDENLAIARGMGLGARR